MHAAPHMLARTYTHTHTQIQAFLQPPMQGVVLQTFGCGNVPASRANLVEELKSASSRGVVIVNCSQCASGHVTENYEVGRVGGTS